MDSGNSSTDEDVLASTSSDEDITVSTAYCRVQLTPAQPMAPMSSRAATLNRIPLTPALQSLLQAIHSGKGITPARHDNAEKSTLLPYSDVPRIYLPLVDEPGFFKAVERAPAVYRCISLRSPVPDGLLVGYDSEDDDLTTASRRHYVTQYYLEMMTARFGRMEGEGTYRRSGRLARKKAPPATTSRGDQDSQRHWFDRPRCPNDESS
jgi:hypothetical protein